MNAINAAWRTCYAAWMRFAHVLGIVNTTVLLTIVYVVVVLPTRSLWWLLRKDPLLLRRTQLATRWKERVQDDPTLEERQHPF